MTRLEVVQTERGWSVELDGHPIATAVTYLTMSLNAAGESRAEVGIVGLTRSRLVGDAVVEVDDDTRHTLQLLGWTPPK